MAESETVHPWIKGAVWAMGVGLAATASISGLLYKQLTDHYDSEIVLARSERLAHRAIIEGMATELARVIKHTEEHEKVADRELERINRIEQQCQDIRNNASSRPDPFTGTEGRELERRLDGRIDALEVQMASCAAMKEQMKSLLEDNIYYRRQLLPIVEDIRNIQQHKKQ